MKRIQEAVPGYDCRNGRCQHEHKGDHGISGGRHFYAVVTDEGDFALSLNVYAHDYPATVDPQAVSERRADAQRSIAQGHGPTANLSAHYLHPTDREQVSAGASQPCSLLPGGTCWDAGSWSLDVGRLLIDNGGTLDTLDAPEAFWLALEKRALEIAVKRRAERADTKWVLCPTCHGEQTIKAGLPTLPTLTEIEELLDGLFEAIGLGVSPRYVADARNKLMGRIGDLIQHLDPQIKE